MSLGVGAYKVGGVRQCSSMRKRYPWRPCEWPPPNRNLLWCLKKEGPANRGEMEPLTPTTPSTKHSSCIEKQTHTYQMNAADSESNTKNCSASPEQFGAKLDCNVEGAVDNKWQGHAMSSQLTRDACKSFQRCGDIKLVCVTSPMSRSLNQVVRNTIASCYCGCPNAEAVAGKIAFNPCGRENLPQPIGQDWAIQRLTIRMKEQGARDISLYREVSQQSVNCAKGYPSQTNMDVATLTGWICFRRFYLNTLCRAQS